MLAYRISPDFRLILIRMGGSATIDHVYDFVNTIVNDVNYDPTYQIIVNNKALKDSEEVNKVCNSLDMAASLIGGFFAKGRTGSVAQICYCRS